MVYDALFMPAKPRDVIIRSLPERNRSRSVSGQKKRLSPLLQESESLGAIERTRTSTVLPTGT